ncbi:MAG: Hpt domain-containing protein [bacterium]|nr:Hpt domain-containing protein [bacterium]
MSLPKLLNEEVTVSRYELGLDFFNEYIEVFTSEAQQTCSELAELFEAANYEQLVRRAHDLKGLCFNLGLERFAAHLKSMENLGKASDREGLSTAVAALEDLKTEAVAALIAYRDAQAD